MADRIFLMRGGRLVQSGTANELYHRPVDFQAARFFSELNEIPGECRDGRVETPLGTFAPDEPVAAGEVVVCIRPQGVKLRPAGEGVPGRLLRRRFLGEVDLLDIAAEGLDRPLQVRAWGSVGAQVGAEVGIEIDRSGILVFPATGE